MSRDANIPYVLLCASVYALSLTVIYQNAYETSRKLVTQNETTLLVIAHPDDEAMFFGPTIIRKLYRGKDDRNDAPNLVGNPSENFYLLCITQGNQNGLGHLRSTELIESAIKLGLKASNIKIMDDVRWLDGENHVWHKQSLQKLIIDEILANNITELITFDEYGVSGHSNHQTIYTVAKSIKLKIDYVKFYTLKSINRVQKYLAFFDFSIFYLFTNSELNQIHLINIEEYFKLVDAFYSHQSQLVWFRRLYSIFSKYMYVNVINELEL